MKNIFVLGLVGICIIFGSFSKVDTAGILGWGQWGKEVFYPEVDERLFEGDIELDGSEKRALKNGWHFESRVGIEGSHYRWTNGIVPYDIDHDFDKVEARIVKTAMRRISRSTCIRFVERIDERDYINFRHGNRCSSPVGRQGYKQDINLKHTCFQEGTIIHELMHALGFWHEQSRFDRDNFITVQYNNIERGHEHDFDQHIHDADTQGIPYDYDSIMHYGEKLFAIDERRNTIVPTGRLPRGLKIGQRDDLSTLDILRINKLYHCHQYIPVVPATSNTNVLIPAKPDYVVHPVVPAKPDYVLHPVSIPAKPVFPYYQSHHR